MNNSISCVIPEITIHNNRAVTTSIAVANYFQKEHKNVLQKIRALECSPTFTTANFSAVMVTVLAGFNEREIEAYEMTKNGFIFLVMGFTGKKAAAFKEAYIAEFDRIEAELLKQSQQPATQSFMPIFPVNADFDLLTSFRGGVPVSAEIVKDGKMLIHPSDAIDLIRRAGSIVIYHKDLSNYPAAQIAALCESARKEEEFWAKKMVS
ncbi:TPA: Rha family transcriptional regulator [Enterobacter kobei]|nr:Rha family transcriptional regulator [Enterobacter kobei]